MKCYLVQFNDAFGHIAVRGVYTSQAGAEAYVTKILTDAGAKDVEWTANRTVCMATANLRGPGIGMEEVMFTVDTFDLLD